MTTFTTQDRVDAEITVEPIPFMGMVQLQDKEDTEQMLRNQLHIVQAECQRLRKLLREAGINEWEDNEYLEKLYAGFAMVGFLMNGDYSIEEIPSRSKALAKAMMEEEDDEEELGIAAVKPKRKYLRRNSR